MMSCILVLYDIESVSIVFIGMKLLTTTHRHATSSVHARTHEGATADENARGRVARNGSPAANPGACLAPGAQPRRGRLRPRATCTRTIVPERGLETSRRRKKLDRKR